MSNIAIGALQLDILQACWFSSSIVNIHHHHNDQWEQLSLFLLDYKKMNDGDWIWCYSIRDSLVFLIFSSIVNILHYQNNQWGKFSLPLLNYNKINDVYSLLFSLILDFLVSLKKKSEVDFNFLGYVQVTT